MGAWSLPPSGILVAKELERRTRRNPDLRIEAQFRVPSLPLAGVVLVSFQLKSLATLINNQLVPIVSYHFGLLTSLFPFKSFCFIIAEKPPRAVRG